MAERQEIPQIATELVEMSREYLRQETLEPAKRLGKTAALGVGGAALLAIGAVLLAWGLYYGFQMLFPEGEWWVVLSRALTAVAAAATAGLVIWRMSVGDNKG